MPDVIKRIHAAGSTVILNSDGSISVPGFYRNGDMRLEVENGKKVQVVAVDRRGRRTVISSFDDLVALNFRWWKLSGGRNTYVVPERPWIDQFIDKKWVRRKVIFEPIDDTVTDDTQD